MQGVSWTVYRQKIEGLGIMFLLSNKKMCITVAVPFGKFFEGLSDSGADASISGQQCCF